MRDLINTRDGATYIAGRVWGIFTHYDLGDSHPLAGHSVPNFELEDGTKIGELMRDGLGILLDFGAGTPLQPLANQYAGYIRYVAGPVKDDLGIAAALVRPDGFVAHASAGASDPNAFADAAKRWFGR
jgi:hypothetical protein